MAAGIPAGLSAKEGRKFGLTVGLAFGILGALLWWRGHSTRGMVALGLCALLVVAGLLLPTRLGPIQRAWMGLAHLMSKVTTPIFLGVVYFALITPIGLFRRFAGWSPISRTKGGGSRWVAHGPTTNVGERMERQY